MLQLKSPKETHTTKVDTAGNQLPYIDAYHRELVGEVEIMKLKLIGGQIDYQTRHYGLCTEIYHYSWLAKTVVTIE